MTLHQKSRIITAEAIVGSLTDALQFISFSHPPSFVEHLTAAWEREEYPAAKNAMAQILVNSRMAAFGRRPMCQDTGTVHVFIEIGIQAQVDFDQPLAELVDEAVARAWSHPDNPLRASMVDDPIFDRRNTRTNAPAMLHVDIVGGSDMTFNVTAKGGGSENKARFVTLNPGSDVVDWVVRTVETLGAGWCPPGVLGIGVGGSGEKAFNLARKALLQPLDMFELLRRGPSSKLEEMRVAIYEKVNALGIGAQGLGGLTTVLDVKIGTCPVHAASLPVALLPQCAADRHVSFTLNGSDRANFVLPNMDLWPDIALDGDSKMKHVALDKLTREEVANWKAGDQLLLSGKVLTGRDAAHRRMTAMLDRGETLPVDLRDRALYYVGPVDAVRDEAVGPAGPTTSSRMDGFTEQMLRDTGLLVMIGKAERGPETTAAIARHGAAYLVAVGGAAYFVSKAIVKSRVVAFEDLGMEAIYEFELDHMPVTVAVDSAGESVHVSGPACVCTAIQAKGLNGI